MMRAVTSDPTSSARAIGAISQVTVMMAAHSGASTASCEIDARVTIPRLGNRRKATMRPMPSAGDLGES